MRSHGVVDAIWSKRLVFDWSVDVVLQTQDGLTLRVAKVATNVGKVQAMVEGTFAPLHERSRQLFKLFFVAVLKTRLAGLEMGHHVLEHVDALALGYVILEAVDAVKAFIIKAILDVFVFLRPDVVVLQRWLGEREFTSTHLETAQLLNDQPFVVVVVGQAVNRAGNIMRELATEPTCDLELSCFGSSAMLGDGHVSRPLGPSKWVYDLPLPCETAKLVDQRVLMGPVHAQLVLRDRHEVVDLQEFSPGPFGAPLGTEACIQGPEEVDPGEKELTPGVETTEVDGHDRDAVWLLVVSADDAVDAGGGIFVDIWTKATTDQGDVLLVDQVK